MTLVAALPIFALLFLASFFFSGTETALFSLQKVDRQRFETAGDLTSKRLLHMWRHRGDVISAILIGNETVNISISALGAFLLTRLVPAYPWLNVLLITPLLLLFSEITPKIIAYRYNTRWARAVALPLALFLLLVTPLRWVVAGVVTLLARPFGVRGPQAEEGLAEADLRTLVDLGTATGGVDERERDIIEAVFDFDDITVGRLMTPLPDVFAVPLDVPWPTLLEQARADFSRIPVYDQRIDNIVGVLLLKDLLKHRVVPPAGPRQLRAMLLPPVFVPRSKPADIMLREFMERRFHMAFVVNEHGTLVGVVTLDDLLSELVGEILDEEDDPTGPEVDRPHPGLVVVKGQTDLDDFEEETGIQLPEGDYDTVAGYLMHELGRIPERGEAVEHQGHRFVVAKVEGRRVTEVHVALVEPEQEAP